MDWAATAPWALLPPPAGQTCTQRGRTCADGRCGGKRGRFHGKQGPDYDDELGLCGPVWPSCTRDGQGLPLRESPVPGMGFPGRWADPAGAGGRDNTKGKDPSNPRLGMGQPAVAGTAPRGPAVGRAPAGEGAAPGAWADLRRADPEPVPLGGRGGGFPGQQDWVPASLARPRR